MTNMFHIILYKPEIPNNTGNIIRLCANMGAELHLIRPLGFELTESKLRRASLDYSDLTVVTEHDTLHDYIYLFSDRRIFATSAWAEHSYAEVEYTKEDSFLFGPESTGLSDWIYKEFPDIKPILIPMAADNRSLNVANAVSVIGYEAWRQNGFFGRRGTRIK